VAAITLRKAMLQTDKAAIQYVIKVCEHSSSEQGNSLYTPAVSTKYLLNSLPVYTFVILTNALNDLDLVASKIVPLR
ncbi:2707_t:CDS:2, partial [Gigaspora margarita]